MSNVTMIMAGTLDDASWVKPGWRSSATAPDHGSAYGARGSALKMRVTAQYVTSAVIANAHSASGWTSKHGSALSLLR